MIQPTTAEPAGAQVAERSSNTGPTRNRLSIAINLKAWDHVVGDETRDLLIWFHQYALDNEWSLTEAGEAINYDATNVSRILRGTYEGSWENVSKAIASFRRVAENRGTIQKNEWVPNRFTGLIYAGLDYALANNSITLITGESGTGKSCTSLQWKNENNHGRSVYITAPVLGGPSRLIGLICRAIGGNPSASTNQMLDQIYRAFNPHRILLIDEAHRLLPVARNAQPKMLEVVRDIHDQSGCALALISTGRFTQEVKATNYQYEQVLGRIGMPIKLPKQFKPEDIQPIVTQYFPKPSQDILDNALELANRRGRVRALVERLKVASRIAGQQKKRLAEGHYWKAVAMTAAMGGDIN